MEGVLRVLTFGFHLLLGLCLFGVGLIGSQAGERIRLPWIPGVGPEDMASTLLALGVFALGSIALAAFRSKLARSPFLVWSLLAAGLIVCAFARPSFRFDGADHFLYSSIALVISLLGVLSSWEHFSGARRPLPSSTESGEDEEAPAEAVGQDD